MEHSGAEACTQGTAIDALARLAVMEQRSMIDRANLELPEVNRYLEPGRVPKRGDQTGKMLPGRIVLQLPIMRTHGNPRDASTKPSWIAGNLRRPFPVVAMASPWQARPERT